MLNELETLNRSLSSRGIRPQAWHSWIKPFGKGSALVAEIGPAGDLVRVSLLSPEEVAFLQNIAPDNQNSFPGFNLNCPLLRLDDLSLWNQPEAQWQVSLAATQQSPLAYEPKDIRRLARLLRDFPEQEIAPRLKGATGPKVQATLALLTRLAGAEPEPETFLRKLSRHIVLAAQQACIPRELALAVLYGRPNKKKAQLESWKITLILDVADLDAFPYRVADPAVPYEWSTALLASEPGSPASAPGASFVCGLSGQPDSPVGDKMPNPKLPLLGFTYLMSMNAAIPCQRRYKRTSTEIFPVGTRSVQRLLEALRHMTEDSRQHKTWAGVPNGFKDRRDLLIAYLEEEPVADVPVVGLFADADPDATQDLATYEARTAQIHAALRRLDRPGRDLHIRVIALSQIDKGRTQVVFSGRYSANAIYQGRDKWLAGARNVPRVATPFAVAKDKPAEWHSNYQPSPAEVMASFKMQWIRSGQQKKAVVENKSVPGVDLGRIYALMLEDDAHQQAGWLLERYLPLTVPLLIGLARPLSGRAKLPDSARKEALIVIAVYGILLLRQGRTKEVYMKNRDYLLGQFLQLADRLHKLYCVHERKGSIPPQLIGNAAISMAMQSPRRAFVVLSSRMAVYLAWADRSQDDDAGWVKVELGRISALLHGQDLDQRVSSNGKAELLLGYLANIEESEKQESLSL